MGQQENIIKVLMEELKKTNTKYKLINYIKKNGLYETLKLTRLKYNKLFSMGISPDSFTRKIKQEFIQDYFDYLGYGIGLSEIDEDPIMYKRNDNEVREIVYMSKSKVIVGVWNWDTGEEEGEYSVLYHNLDDNIIDIIFDIVVELYDNNFDL